MKRNFFMLCALFFVLTATASAAEKTPAVLIDTQTSETLVRPLLAHFLNFDGVVFSKLVANEFVPNKFDFLRELQDDFYKIRPITLDFVSGEAKASKDKVIVNFKWQRTSYEGTPRKVIKKTGSAEFIFLVKGSEYLLYKVGGSNPFGN